MTFLARERKLRTACEEARELRDNLLEIYKDFVTRHPVQGPVIPRMEQNHNVPEEYREIFDLTRHWTSTFHEVTESIVTLFDPEAESCVSLEDLGDAIDNYDLSHVSGATVRDCIATILRPGVLRGKVIMGLKPRNA